MIEVKGNLWTYQADVRVITTNGTVKKNGECVMGRGCAAEAKQRFGPYKDKTGPGPHSPRSYPGIAKALGDLISRNGNIVFCLADRETGWDPDYILSFPVKHQWMEKADIELIRRSAGQLVAVVDLMPPDVRTVVMPRPGCGNGGLRWDDVKPVLEPILDDRFHVITF